MPAADDSDRGRAAFHQLDSAPDRNAQPVSEQELVAWSVTTRDPRAPDGGKIELFDAGSGACHLGCGGYHEGTANVPSEEVGHRPSCPWPRLVAEVLRLRRP